MKTMLLTLGCLLALGGVAHAGSVRIENGDSKAHTIQLKCSGSAKSVEVRASTTATYTFHSTSKSCDIVGGTIAFPTSKLEDGQRWQVKGGKAK
ncbi:MAG: hypothetical protein KC635_18140 [Myxococcales bacterium]|nr:hypothetical protein [Myxococcales bacterium]MCB9732142.1 hypothetical protein [Deltaproteobacteria bacterium]